MANRNPLYANPSPNRQPGAKCSIILQKCLAIQLQKTGSIPYQPGPGGRSVDASDYWMYDNGYLLFQGFLEANSKCFWNLSLLEAVKELQFEGYVSQGILLVRGSPCALEVLRSAWSRNVLKAPTNYSITQIGFVRTRDIPVEADPVWVCYDLKCLLCPCDQDHVCHALWHCSEGSLIRGRFWTGPSCELSKIVGDRDRLGFSAYGDIEDCLISLINQGQFTPLPEALCWVILELTSSGQHAVLESIRNCLHLSFPDIERPSSQVVYDTLAKLMADKKIYQTSQGYFIVTPETRRLRPQKPDSSPLMKRAHRRSYSDVREEGRGKPLLMTNEEALTYVHGEMTTIRDGDITHQSIQTNLADVICGGNPNDKILYASVPKRSTSFPLERRNSLKLFGSNKRLNGTLTRSGSMKYIPHKSGTILTDSSSSTECNSQEYQPLSTKKTSLLARLFRRSGRKRGLSAPPRIHTFSAQFPPAEWFNPKVIHMHCVGTQTKIQDSGMDNQTIQWDMEPSSRYSTSRLGKARARDSNQMEKESHIYQKPKHDDKTQSNADSLKRRQDKTDHSSMDQLQMTDRSPYRQLYPSDRCSRRSSLSKSSKSLNKNYDFCDKSEGRIYEEIKNKSSDSFPKLENLNENIYTKILDKKARSNDGLLSEGKIGKKEAISSSPSTPKYKRKTEKRSSSLPRRKISSTSMNRADGVTHTDFPYDENLVKREDTPITPSLTNRRSSSYENVNSEDELPKEKEGKESRKEEKEGKYTFEDIPHDMTSLTSSGYDTQTNSIVSTCEQIPYSLKISKSYINSTTPPPSLTITEDFERHKNKSENSSRSISPYNPPKQGKALVNVSSNISVTSGSGNKNSLSVQVTTGEEPEVFVSSETDGRAGESGNTHVYVQNSPHIASLITFQSRKNGKLERFPSLYSPRELLKTGYGYEHVEFQPARSSGESDVERETTPDFDIGLISKNQEGTEKFAVDGEKDDYGLSHKPIPRYSHLDFGQMCNASDKAQGQGKKTGSKIPVMKSRGNKIFDRPLSIDNSHAPFDQEKHEFHEFPSLSDLSVNFKSIAAQNILNNISVTSVDTLVEVNMAANNLNEKTNPLVNVHTDFGLL